MAHAYFRSEHASHWVSSEDAPVRVVHAAARARVTRIMAKLRVRATPDNDDDDARGRRARGSLVDAEALILATGPSGSGSARSRWAREAARATVDPRLWSGVMVEMEE